MLLMTVSLTCYTQDSTRRIPVKKWQLDRLINDAYAIRTCDSMLVSYEYAKNMCDSLLSITLRMNENLRQQVKIDSLMLHNQQISIQSMVNINDKRRKQSRWQGRKEGMITGFLVALILMIL
ncbi:MAG: hypothetical protein KatS3mg031_2953 [Chitinophagales bacterium]|nr:MAG: hypothetical protein KatS3mg031_2953 [Chitinophagales bacterium]